MPIRRMLLAALLSIAPLAAADAAILIEARKGGEPFRMVVDNQQGRALIRTTRGESLVDLRRGDIYVRGTSGVARKMKIRRSTQPELAAYRVEPWGPGPRMAGQATVYHVISRGDEICAEMLVSSWMTPFVEPLVQALDVLEEAARPSRGRSCERIPFAVYAAAGWPIIAGKLDHLTFETQRISFEYQPGERELALPVHYETTRPDQAVLEAFAPKP